MHLKKNKYCNEVSTLYNQGGSKEWMINLVICTLDVFLGNHKCGFICKLPDKKYLWPFLYSHYIGYIVTLVCCPCPSLNPLPPLRPPRKSIFVCSLCMLPIWNLGIVAQVMFLICLTIQTHKGPRQFQVFKAKHFFWLQLVFWRLIGPCSLVQVMSLAT